MAKVVIIGAGGVGTVVAHKCAQHPEVFTEIVIASRTRSKCDAIVDAIGKPNISSDVVDADSVPQLVELFNRHKPELVINVALPYQDLTIMDACLICGVNYLDTANYEPKDVAHFEYSWQWAYKKRFEDAGLTAILGCGFDPGVSGVFTAYAAKHYFSDMEYLDIVDCNGGDHGKAFATNFNPEINIREITQNGRYYEDGKWVTTGPLEIHKTLTYPNIGERESYLLYHEELESLVKNYPSIKRARFWMTFGQEYLTHLRVIQNIGMEGLDKEGKHLTYYIWNNCSHEAAYRETGMQAVSYTTGVPAMVGAMMFITGKWVKPGVNNVEEFDPDPFLDELAKNGLPWNERFNIDLEV